MGGRIRGGAVVREAMGGGNGMKDQRNGRGGGHKRGDEKESLLN